MLGSLLKRIRRFKDIHYRDCFIESREGYLVVPFESKEAFSPYNKSVPDQAAVEYLMEMASLIKKREEFVIDGPRGLEECFRAWFALNLKREERHKRHLVSISIVLIVIGCLLIALSIFDLYGEVVLSEAVDVVGGFMIWEASDFLIFHLQDIRRRQYAYLRLMRAEWIGEEGAETREDNG